MRRRAFAGIRAEVAPAAPVTLAATAPPTTATATAPANPAETASTVPPTPAPAARKRRVPILAWRRIGFASRGFHRCVADSGFRWANRGFARAVRDGMRMGSKL
ncbi:hypothetical protein CE91St30_20080 [Raoultibacter timonensis]|uniref:Uncharacterized protein n=1 Tax=Raoultibacter timonensis TaxID=1907662 RepID=A0ABM7WK48_9ACTN|nr:hypothetical protein CE91St30_20080 [Raoultibacter timonensis]BDF51278.1 hypothetical protein CE91St31_20080 [Raoultibacter timonensis]